MGWARLTFSAVAGSSGASAVGASAALLSAARHDVELNGGFLVWERGVGVYWKGIEIAGFVVAGEEEKEQTEGQEAGSLSLLRRARARAASDLRPDSLLASSCACPRAGPHKPRIGGRTTHGGLALGRASAAVCLGLPLWGRGVPMGLEGLFVWGPAGESGEVRWVAGKPV